jgi:hypothetical protein
MGGIERMDNPQGPYLADKLAGTGKIGPKKASMGPWTSPDGTIFPLGKPKGKAKQVKINVPLWEVPDVELAMRKAGYTSMGLFIQAGERNWRRVEKDKRAAARRARRIMAVYNLEYRDLEAI